jgi:predicted enzyme related to lactoylglutathione lyase
MNVHYLEYVTPAVEETVKMYEKLYGVSFGDPIAELGGARTAPLGREGEGRVGVRPPLRPDEAPIVRPYYLVQNMEERLRDAEAAGATVALPPTLLSAQVGTCAIYLLGGIEHALWQGGGWE